MPTILPIPKEVKGRNYIPKQTSSKLQKLRLKKSLTQEELSQKAGISITTISNLERGIYKKVNPKTSQAIADALRCSVSDFID